MGGFSRTLCALMAGLTTFVASASGDEKAPYAGKGCAGRAEDFFIDEVWAKVASQSCLTCHKAGGDAEDTRFVLRDPEKVVGPARDVVLLHNRDAFAKMARLKEKKGYRILIKATGGLDHGGSEVLPADSPGYKILADFVARVNDPKSAASVAAFSADDKNQKPFFDGVAMLDERRLLRRVALSLVGRLPTAEELSTVAGGGLESLDPILDRMLEEEAFYTRLREGFNDIFLTLGVTGNPDQTIFSYDHFSTTRQWFMKYDLSSVGDEAAQRKARYKLTDDFRDGSRGEPMKLVEYIVRNNRPFTEIVTADYIMVTPYTARSYGVFEELKSHFKNPDDPFEYVPVRLKALKGRAKSQDQDSESGYYPHAGMLSMFHYLRRYPTTETNRNRLRARMYFQHFLGIDALELAARVSDAAAVSAKYEIPTMQASECVVCHKMIDPIASMFQDYSSLEGVYGKRKDGWYKDMFQAGYEGEDLPPGERWRALQWLGERTAQDPRFAVAMTEHVYYILTGRKVLLPPKDLNDPRFDAKRRAYAEQRRVTERIAGRLAAANFNLKQAFKDWIVSDFYRVDGLETETQDPARLAELDDVGLVRLIAPEQMERKIEAIFDQRWGKLTAALAMLYGGIDSNEVTERAADPSGAMGAIQRILANEVAVRNTLRDFALPRSERRLFPGIEPEVLPGRSPTDDAQIRLAVAHLHHHILGRDDAVDSEEVSRTFQLFAGIVSDARQQPSLSKEEIYEARVNVKDPPADPHYTIRAWRGVVTYLLRRQEFLYE